MGDRLGGRRGLILVLTDSEQDWFCRNLKILYPDRVHTLDITTREYDLETLRPYDYVLTFIRDGKNVEKIRYKVLDRYAAEGHSVVMCLYEYARRKSLRFNKEYTGKLRPMIEILVENDVTKGFKRSDRVYWYGNVGGGVDDPESDQLLQRQILDLEESENVRVLARSTVNGGAVFIEEKVGDGRIIAMDLISPNEAVSWDFKGSANKYVFLGNILGGTVRYGKYYQRKLSYDEFVEAMKSLCEKYVHLWLEDEGASSDGSKIYSINAGNRSKPLFLFVGCLHGWEWENSYGLLTLAEYIGSHPEDERINLEEFFIKIIPIANPYGYKNNTRQNANGVDLNRNFDFKWEEYKVQHPPQDVAQPWDYDWKGESPASEAETKILQRIIDSHEIACVVDFHSASSTAFAKPKRPDDAVLNLVYGEIVRNLKDRYIRALWGTEGKHVQLSIDHFGPLSDAPEMVNYASKKGLSFLIETVGNRDETHGTVMHTDMVVEICLATLKVIGEEVLRRKGKMLN